MKSRMPSEELGVALMQVLLIGTALLGLATMGLVLGRNDQVISNNILNGGKAFWMASAGLEIGRASLRDSYPLLPADINSTALADGTYAVTVTNYGAANDGRFRIHSDGTAPNNARKALEEIVRIPNFRGRNGLVQIDGAGAPVDLEEPGGGPGYRIPDFSIDTRGFHLNTGTDPPTWELDPDCPPVPPVGALTDYSNTGMEEELDKLRCGIVQRANECCVDGGGTSTATIQDAAVCSPGTCPDPPAEDGSTCTPGTCTQGSCHAGSCQGATCISGTCTVGTPCTPGACAGTDCAPAACQVTNCRRGSCGAGENCAVGACTVGTCEPGPCLDDSCVPGHCKNGKCRPGTDCSGANCEEATCPLIGCGPGACTDATCVSGTCDLVDGGCSPGTTCGGSQCVAGNCPVTGCEAGTCAAEGCVAAVCEVVGCGGGGSCGAEDTTCIAAACIQGAPYRLCPDGLCEADAGLYWVRSLGLATPFKTQNVTPAIYDPNPACTNANMDQAECTCTSLNVGDARLRATGTEPPGANPPAAPYDRGPIVLDTPANDGDDYPVNHMSQTEVDEITQLINDLLDDALDTPVSSRYCIENSYSGEAIHSFYGRKVTIVASPNDSNEKIRKLSRTSPCSGGSVNNFEIKAGATVEGSGLLILPRELVIKDATFNWRGVVVILENGRITIRPPSTACGAIYGGVILQRPQGGANNARLDLDKNLATAACPNAFSINYSCDEMRKTGTDLLRTLAWLEIFGG